MEIRLEDVRGESLRILAKALIEIADVQEKELHASRRWRDQAAERWLAQPPVNAGAVAAPPADPLPVLTPVDEADLAPRDDVVEPPGIPEQPAAATVTLEQVRAKFSQLSQGGKKAEVKALLQQFGAAKLTDVEPAKFADLLTAAEAL